LYQRGVDVDGQQLHAYTDSVTMSCTGKPPDRLAELFQSDFLNSQTRPATTLSISPTLALATLLALLAKQGIASWGGETICPPGDGISTVAIIAADLRPSADESAVRTSLVAGGG